MGLTREGAGRAGALGRGGPTPTAAATVSQPCPRRRRSKLAPWGAGTPATTKHAGADHGRCVTASVRLRLGVADTARRAGAEVAGRGRAGLEQERVEHGSRGTVVHRARVSEATQIAWPKSSDFGCGLVHVPAHFATPERELRRGRRGAMTGPNRRSRGDAPLCRRRHALFALRERRGAGRQLAVPRGHPRHG